MKTLIKIILVAMPLLLGSCSLSKKTAKAPVAQPDEVTADTTLLGKVNKKDTQNEYVVSKVKFSLEKGVQEITLTGNLRMKHDDVIQLQLMAFGMVEAARMEFTPDYVLLIDRINKQFLKATYAEVDFLRNQGINFYTLQALFRATFFMPGKNHPSASDMKSFTTEVSGSECVVSYEHNHMLYTWLTDVTTNQIKMANIVFRSLTAGNTQLSWDYQDYATLNKVAFPSRHYVTVTSQDITVNLTMNLSYLKNKSGWETRTKVSDKYRQVSVDDMLRRFLALG